MMYIVGIAAVVLLPALWSAFPAPAALCRYCA